MVRHEVLHLTMYVQLCITLIYSVYPCMYSIHKVGFDVQGYIIHVFCVLLD